MNKEPLSSPHEHHYPCESAHNELKVKIVFALTLLTMLAEIAVGTWSGSMALLADGWHMGTHAAAFAIAIFAYHYAKKHAHNPSFSFGTGKVQYLGGFASAVALSVVALMMAIESIERLVNPQNIHFNEAIVVAFIGLAVNVASVFILHDKHHHHTHDHHHHDHNLKAAYFHVLADALTSILAIAALFSARYFGWMWLDALMGIVGAVIISKWAYNLLHESSSVLLDKNHRKLQVMREKLEIQHQVKVVDLHIWTIAQNHNAAIVSIETEEPVKLKALKQQLKQDLPSLAHVNVELIDAR